MKTISLSVSESDYSAFQRAAKRRDRPAAELIREAMAFYRAEKLEDRSRLETIPVIPGHEPTGPLPDRAEVYGEIYGSDDDE
jgi:hypothetical protein